MESKIFKYELELRDGAQEFDLPMGATPLHVNMQNGKLCLWAMVFPDTDTEKRTFEVYGTGYSIPEPISAADYIGTAHQIQQTMHDTKEVQLDHLVWHVFEVQVYP